MKHRKPFTVYLDPSLEKWVRLFAKANDRTLSKETERALLAYKGTHPIPGLK